MDTRSLVRILQDLRTDIAQSEVSQAVQSFVRGTSKSPTRFDTPGAVPEVSRVREAARAIADGRIGRYGGVRRRRLQELGLADRIGPGLARRIEASLQPPLTVAAARHALATLGEEITAVAGVADRTLEHLRHFDIEPDHEVPVLPSCLIRISTGGRIISIDDMRTLVHDWDLHLQTFSQVAVGARESRPVRQIGSGSIELSLTLSGYSEAAVIAIVIGGIGRAALSRWNLRRAKRMVSSESIDPRVPELIGQEEAAIEDRQRTATADEIEQYIPDEHRSPELKIAIEKAIAFVHERTTAGDVAEIALPGEGQPESLPPEAASHQALLPVEEAIALIHQANAEFILAEAQMPNPPSELPPGASE